MKQYLNLPIEDFMNTIDAGINNGFTLAWDGDIGNSGGFEDNGYVKVKGEMRMPPQSTRLKDKVRMREKQQQMSTICM